MIHNATARKMERLFNVLPQNVRNISGITTNTFKDHLDEWLKGIPDTPRIDGYGAEVPTESNNIYHQSHYGAHWQGGHYLEKWYWKKKIPGKKFKSLEFYETSDGQGKVREFYGN